MAKYLQNSSDIQINEIGDNLQFEIIKSQLLNSIYPIGSIYMSATNTNPGSTLGGTWELWGAGRVPVGVDTTQTEFNVVEKTGGAKTHKLTIDEMPNHTHSIKSGNKNNTWVAPNGVLAYQYQGETALISDEWTVAKGGSQPHNNLQPYITCYMFKRTA